MIELHKFLVINSTLVVCVLLRWIFRRYLTAQTRLAVWHALTLWLYATLLPGNLPFAGSLWQILALPGQPMPPLPIAEMASTPAAVDIISTWPDTLSLVWAAGVLVMLVWFTCSQYWLYRTQKRLFNRSEKQGVTLPLPKRTQVYTCYAIDTPITMSVWRPAIFLPISADELSVERQTMVLTHEIAHIKKHDALFKMLLLIICGLYWYCPLVWVMAWLVPLDMEHRCDETVLEHCGIACKATYIQLLLQFAGITLPIGQTAQQLSARKELMTRVAHIKAYQKRPICISVLTLTLALCIVLLFGTTAPKRQPLGGDIGAVSAQSAPGAHDARALTQATVLGWTGPHTVLHGEATVYTNNGDTWQLKANQTVQLRIKLPYNSTGGILVGYFDVDRQQYVPASASVSAGVLRLKCTVPLTGNYLFWAIADGGTSLDVHSTTITIKK